MDAGSQLAMVGTRARSGRSLAGGATGATLRHEPTTPTLHELLAGINRMVAEAAVRPLTPELSRALLGSVSTIPDDMVRDAVDAVALVRVGDRSLVGFIEERLSRNRRKVGRPSKIPVTALIVAALLCGVDFRAVSGVQISLMLYGRISAQARFELGLPIEAAPPPPGPLLKTWNRKNARRAQRAFRRLCSVFDPSPYPHGTSRTWVELDQMKRIMTVAEEHELQQALDLLTTSIQQLAWQYLPAANLAAYDGSACIDATPLRLASRGRSVHDEHASCISA